ncbi:hypothetical protein NECAME_16853 [Necator americanus]|uniref:Uncharacterized protein n=1 Tax=Necator americanus TaxID=51031 RepID=W2TW09_NECAM|nr:hypothetical protein NECAME_16853 [Necator americanus]ETN85237.1 hypothetical protein NECAME_16853 [Necator americanus]
MKTNRQGFSSSKTALTPYVQQMPWKREDDVVSAVENDFSVLYEFKHREKLSDKVIASLLSISRSHLMETCQRKKRVLLQMPYNYK